MLIKENKRFIALFKSYISKLGSTSGYNYQYSGYSSYNGGSGSVYSGYSSVQSSSVKPSSNTIYFYEFSNLQNKSRIFNSYAEFVKFCKDYNITMCDHHENMIKNRYYVYATCIPGTSVLMVRNTYHELNQAMTNYIKNPIVGSNSAS